MKKLLKFVVNGFLFMVLVIGLIIYFDQRSDSKFEEKYEVFANDFVLSFSNPEVPSKYIIGKLDPSRLEIMDVDGLQRVKNQIPQAGNLEELLKIGFDGVTYSTEGSRGEFKFKVTFEKVILLAVIEVVEKEDGPYVYKFSIENIITYKND